MTQSVADFRDVQARVRELLGGVAGAWDIPGYLSGGQVLFESSGDFEKADYPGLRAVIVECQGPGGSGAASATAAAGNVSLGSGGRSGAYARKFALASALGASETVTVGPAVAGASAGANNGGDGATTSFGSHCTAEGGIGGVHRPAGTAFPVQWGGAQASASGTGDLVIPGRPAPLLTWAEARNRAITSAGADSLFGAGGRSARSGNASPAPGQDAEGYGAGGGGAATSEGQTQQAGGASAPGLVIVTLLY